MSIRRYIQQVRIFIFKINRQEYGPLIGGVNSFDK